MSFGGRQACLLMASAVVVLMLMAGCKGEKRIAQYSSIYEERPSVIYVMPVDDLSMRRAMRTADDSLYNASLNTATKHLYLTAQAPMVYNGYYVLGPLASAQIAAGETRTGRQLRNESITDYHTDLGIDAVLFITLHSWKQANSKWTVVAEYVLRSTISGNELMHTWVTANKELYTDHKGNPKPLEADIDFARKMGCDLPTAQRCRLVETLNRFVLKDLPAGKRARSGKTERYIASHPEYFKLTIQKDGTVRMSSAYEDGDEAFKP